MSAVDVLAVMDRVFAATGPADIEVALWDLPEARAAVAELIEADKEYDAALDAYHDALPDGLGANCNLSEDHPAVIRLREAGSRRRAALARVSGDAS